MNKQEVEEYLNEIYIDILNSVDEMCRYKNESDFVRIVQKLDFVKKYVETNKRFKEKYDVLYNAAFFISNGRATNEKEALDAIKYFDWLKNAKNVATKQQRNETITIEDAIRLANASAEVNYPVDSDIRKMLYKNMYPKEDVKNTPQSPKKVSAFDKIINKLRSLFGRKKRDRVLVSQRAIVQSNVANRRPIPELERANEFRKENRVNINKRPEKKPDSKKETLVIGDLHGNMQKWLYVKEALRKNPNLKIIILGDAMDRGQYGLEILLQIKELNDKGRVIYLPGNHDVFAYNYLKAKGTQFEDYESAQIAKANWEENGGKVTMQSFDNFNQIVQKEIRRGNLSKIIDKNELIDWLGNCPIQMKVEGIKHNYALAHAMFDEELYNEDPKFNLKKALTLELAGNNDKKINKFYNCMWYRECDKSTHYAELSWPKDSVVLVGHTSQDGVKFDNLDNDPYKAILYLDCGKGSLQGFSLTKDEHIQIEQCKNDERN